MASLYMEEWRIQEWVPSPSKTDARRVIVLMRVLAAQWTIAQVTLGIWSLYAQYIIVDISMMWLRCCEVSVITAQDCL